MNDYEQRIKVLEDKVKILEETLETLKNMQMSEQMEGYIKAKTRTLKMAELINSVSDDNELDLSKEQNALNEIKNKKKSIDEQVESALKSNYSEECATDIKYFEYEIENGMGDYDSPVQELAEYIGKGIRITAYNGFDCKSIIIPKEIDGLLVTSIGEKVFQNTSISKVILPKSLKAILKNAFYSCSQLTHIDLPDGLVHMGFGCFEKSGLKKINIPDSVYQIKYNCFWGCKNMTSAHIGKNLSTLESNVFRDTAINTLIIPENVQRVSNCVIGSNFYRDANVTFVFLGKETTIDGERLKNVKMIYCLPGSNAQKHAREYNIPMKPLSEFKMEE